MNKKHIALRLNADLLKDARANADATNLSLTALIEKALENHLKMKIIHKTPTRLTAQPADYLSFKYMPDKNSQRFSTVELREALLAHSRCARCGYHEFPSALCFHHVDPSTKERGVSALIARHAQYPSPTKLQRILEEVAKCIILCANCHNALHAGQWKLDNSPRYQPVMPRELVTLASTQKIEREADLSNNAKIALLRSRKPGLHLELRLP